MAQGTEVREQYTYDDAGNLTEVSDAGAPAPVAITSFSPAQGTVGQRVTIAGTGFSTDAAGNLVQVAGVPASILSASANQLAIEIPASASTGRIVITTGDGTALSVTDFVVLKPLVVSDFTPRIGAAGTVLTILGDGFDPIAPNDRVNVGAGAATVTAATTSSITATLGAGTTTGKVRVSTEYSSGTSAQDFFVPPSGVAAADVEFTGRVAPGVTSTVTLSTPGKAGVLAFDAAAGQHLTLNVTGLTLAGTTFVTFYDPTGGLFHSVNVVAGQTNRFTLPEILQSGTYTILVRPALTSAGAMSFTLFPDVEVQLDPRGAPVAVRLAPGQYGRCWFEGRPGDIFALAYPTFATEPTGRSVAIDLYDSKDLLIASAKYGGVSSPGSWQMPGLSGTGRHYVRIRPDGAVGGTFTFLLSVPLAGKLAIDGPSVRFQSLRPGQGGRYFFDAAAGQSLTLRATASASFPNRVAVVVTQADGSLVSTNTSLSLLSGGDAKIDLCELPSTQRYWVSVSPSGLDTGTVDLQLLAQDTGTIVVDGSARPVSITAGGNGRYTFAGTAGDVIGVAAQSLATTPTNSVRFTIVSPSGAPVLPQVSFSASDSAQWPALPETGTYTLAVAPGNTAAASMSLWLSRPLAGTLTADASPVRFQSSRPGQAGRYAFDVTAGQSYTLRLTAGSTFPSGVPVTVYDPTGQALPGRTLANGGDIKVDVDAVTKTGTYSVWVVPKKVETGAIDIRLITAASDTLAIGDAPKPVSVVAGQNGRYSFTGSAGDLLGLGFPSLSFTPTGGAATIVVYRPDGSILSSTTASGPGSAQLDPLPASGTYTISFKPPGAAAGTIAFLLSRTLTGALPTTGAESVLNLTRVGQGARYTFTAAADDSYALAISASATLTSGVNVSVLRPNGTVQTGAAGSVGANTPYRFALDRLPTAGTYTVVLSPAAAGTGSVSMHLTPPATGAIAIGEPARAFTLPACQSGRYTFDATAGDLLKLAISPLVTTPSGALVRLTIEKPDGSALTGWNFFAANTFLVPQIPISGTYTIAFAPAGTAAASASLQLSRR